MYACMSVCMYVRCSCTIALLELEKMTEGGGGGKIDTQLNKKNECNWKCVNFTTAPVTPHS